MKNITRALSIRQPFVDQIFNKTKVIEYRTIPTKIINETVYIYAAKKYITGIKGYPIQKLNSLPRGVIVGTVKISKCVPSKTEKGVYLWYLSESKKFSKYLKPKRKPQPVWFRPF
ncbi:MAG: ASCH domain-containing protein [Spirochaetes bacterium]|nr:ASCH domain-containing protein [Spirochaetota bacterium]